MGSLFRLHDDGDQSSLTFYTGELPVDEAIVLADLEPNGYFFEGVLSFVAPSLAEGLELDSEAGMFCAYGPVDKLQEAQSALEPYLTDKDQIRAVIERAEAAGINLEDPVEDNDEIDGDRPGFLGRLFRRN